VEKNRLEAFSDGVIAIIITIMVLELRPPPADAADLHTTSLAYLKPMLPVFYSYVQSFIYVGIYWNNHHHLFHSTKRVTGGILWANLYLLFWLSLFPFTTAWAGQSHLAATPVAVYGFVLLMAAIAYFILQTAIIRQQGPNSLLAKAIGNDWKGKVSPICYLSAIPLAYVSAGIAVGLYLLVALMWLVPDRRIECALAEEEGEKD
jgi:uncharacterized membrane protein